MNGVRDGRGSGVAGGLSVYDELSLTSRKANFPSARVVVEPHYGSDNNAEKSQRPDRSPYDHIKVGIVSFGGASRDMTTLVASNTTIIGVVFTSALAAVPAIITLKRQ